MRITFYCFLLFTLFTCAQDKGINNQNFEVTVIPINCKYKKEHAFLKEFTLLKDGKELKKVSVGHNSPAIISGLTKGHYEIKYRSIYNRWEVIKFQVNQGTENTIKLCMDYFDYSSNRNILLIDEIEENETLQITYRSRGCFHNKKDEFHLSRKNNRYFLKYHNTKISISDKQHQLLREFEIELRANLGVGCTTTDTYSFYNDKPGQFDQYYSVNDSSCSWGGFNFLIKELGLETE